MAERGTVVRVLSTRATRGVLEALVPGFTRATGIAAAIDYGATNELMPRIAAGEAADLVLLSRAAMDRLVADRVVVPESRTDIARSLVGMAVKAGAPHPDISTVDALVATLRAARAVALSKTGASGLHFARVLERLGIAREMAAKTIVRDGFTAERAVSGEADLAVQQMSELLAVKGIELVGPLPEAVQEVSWFSGGILARAENPEGARALLAHLVAPEARAALEASGLSAL